MIVFGCDVGMSSFCGRGRMMLDADSSTSASFDGLAPLVLMEKKWSSIIVMGGLGGPFFLRRVLRLTFWWFASGEVEI